MRPAIARRRTECNFCHKIIEPGEDRLDDVVKAKNFYKRLHYHPPCFAQKATQWFDNNRDKVPEYTHGGGRPPLDMTEEDKASRHKLLIKLSNLFSYYLPKLNLQTPTEELSFDDLRKMLNFQNRFSKYAEQLQPLGGLPPKYRERQLPDISDALVAISKPLQHNSD